jgi:hypothetical protein
MDEPKQSWWNYLADHPKTAGATALIALAVSFSPKASVAACWLLIAASWIIAAAAISGTPVIKKSKIPCYGKPRYLDFWLYRSLFLENG